MTKQKQPPITIDSRMASFLRAFLTMLFWAATLQLTACQAEDTRAATMVGYNYTERPIGGFSVNGVGGSNIFVNGRGGGFSCCVDVTVGHSVNIKWRYHRTKKQRDAGIPIEDRETTAIIPSPQTAEAGYLEVHFYPDHHVELALVTFPGKRRLPKIPEDD